VRCAHHGEGVGCGHWRAGIRGESGILWGSTAATSWVIVVIVASELDLPWEVIGEASDAGVGGSLEAWDARV